MKIAIMGVGFCGAFPVSGGLSYREMIARAASAAYNDAGIEASELDGAVSCEEDFNSGYSIADEYVPDQLGVQRKSVYTVPGDFLQGLCSAAMQIRTGRFKLLAVQSYSKASNMLTKDELLHFAYDPAFNRFGVSPHYLAGIEMQQFMHSNGYAEEEIADLVVLNKKRAISNPLSPHAGITSVNDVLGARPVATPLTEPMIAKPSDGSVVVVLGAEDIAGTASNPVFVSGTGWCSANSIIERRENTLSEGTLVAADMAYKEAGVDSPTDDLDAVYVSDLYPHRELMHLEAMRYEDESFTTVNPDGGSQAMGDLYEANGGARLYDAVLQLRGEAGAHQIAGAKRIAVQGWRGVPTDTCAVVVLDSGRSTS
jgi:acetyl-CoA C-acetyltransferase